MTKRTTYLLIALSALIVLVVYLMRNGTDGGRPAPNANPQNLSALELTARNYSDQIEQLSERHDLPYEYLMSLIVLECSGHKPAGHRYEKGVYRKLLQVRDGERKKYENIRQKHLKGASDEAIKNLATSWGPFQLMGYKCIPLGAEIHEIRGDAAASWGVRWIENEYGKYLRDGKFKDAFHIHNTGQKFPRNGKARTHDPSYIDRGLRYVDHFRQKKTASR
jgi:hypothetical protein